MRSSTSRAVGADSTLIKELRDFFDTRTNEKQYEDHLYTDQSLLKRESIRFEHEIQRLIKILWNATRRSGERCIYERDYIPLNKLMYKALVGSEADEDESHRIAQEDWKTDSRGKSSIDFVAFSTSIFQVRHSVRVDIVCGY